jgi:hypothetical protein
MKSDHWAHDLRALLDRLDAAGAGASLSACHLAMALDHMENAARDASAGTGTADAKR